MSASPPSQILVHSLISGTEGKNSSDVPSVIPKESPAPTTYSCLESGCFAPTLNSVLAYEASRMTNPNATDSPKTSMKV